MLGVLEQPVCILAQAAQLDPICFPLIYQGIERQYHTSALLDAAPSMEDIRWSNLDGWSEKDFRLL
jgi:hypothetical protein